MPPSRAERLLAQRPFVLFLVARVFAMIAHQMLAVAVGWQMYTLTGSALDLGLIGLAQFAAVVLPRAGRRPRRRPFRPAPRAATLHGRPRRVARARPRRRQRTGASASGDLRADLRRRRGTRVPDADDAGAAAGARPAGAAVARHRGERVGQPGGDHRRPGARRPASTSPGRQRSTSRAWRCSCSTGLGELIRIRTPPPAPRQAARPRLGVRRHPLHSQPAGGARRDLARHVRGAARRRDGAAADLRARHPAHRARGGSACCVRAPPSVRSAMALWLAHHPLRAPRRTHDVRRGGRVRRRDHRVRRVALVRRVARSRWPCSARRT